MTNKVKFRVSLSLTIMFIILMTVFIILTALRIEPMSFMLFMMIISILGFAICLVLTMYVLVKYAHYKCPKCGHEFQGDKMEVLLAPYVTPNRRMKCPNCHETSWCKEEIK